MEAQVSNDTLNRYQSSDMAWPVWQKQAEANRANVLIESLEAVADVHERHVQGKTLLRNLYFRDWQGKDLATLIACADSVVKHCQHAAQNEEAAKEWWVEETARIGEQMARFLAIGWNDGLARSETTFAAGKRFAQMSLQLRQRNFQRLRNLAESYLYLGLHEAKLGLWEAAAEAMSEALSRFIEIEMKYNRPTALATTRQLDLVLCYGLLSFVDQEDVDDHTLTQVWLRLKELERDVAARTDVLETTMRLKAIIQDLGGSVSA